MITTSRVPRVMCHAREGYLRTYWHLPHPRSRVTSQKTVYSLFHFLDNWTYRFQFGPPRGSEYINDAMCKSNSDCVGIDAGLIGISPVLKETVVVGNKSTATSGQEGQQVSAENQINGFPHIKMCCSYCPFLLDNLCVHDNPSLSRDFWEDRCLTVLQCAPELPCLGR